MPFILGVVGSAAQGTRRASGGGYGYASGYYNSDVMDSNAFCNNMGNTAATVYFSGSGAKTFADLYSSGSTIFSNTNLSTSASAGHYGDTNGGNGNTYYLWDPGSGGWSGTGMCP